MPDKSHTIKVKGYTRSDGTYVQGYERAANVAREPRIQPIQQQMQEGVQRLGRNDQIVNTHQRARGVTILGASGGVTRVQR